MDRPYRIVGHPLPAVDRHPVTGQVVEGYTIHAQDVDTGQPVKVFVPKQESSPEGVHAYVQTEANHLHDIKQIPGSLTGDS